MTRAEIDRLFEVLDEHDAKRKESRVSTHPDFAPLIKVLFYTGARLSEVHRLSHKDALAAGHCLMWDQVDLDAGVIALGRTKDKKSKVIYLCQQAIDLLRAHRKRKLDEGALSKPVFECFNPGRTWVTLVRPKVGLDKSLTQEAFTLHGFRHNFLTYAAEAGLPESIRKRLVGHAKSRDVTEGYTLVSPAHMKRQVQRVGDALENLNFETSYLQA